MTEAKPAPEWAQQPGAVRLLTQFGQVLRCPKGHWYYRRTGLQEVVGPFETYLAARDALARP